MAGKWDKMSPRRQMLIGRKLQKGYNKHWGKPKPDTYRNKQ